MGQFIPWGSQPQLEDRIADVDREKDAPMAITLGGQAQPEGGADFDPFGTGGVFGFGFRDPNALGQEFLGEAEAGQRIFEEQFIQGQPFSEAVGQIEEGITAGLGAQARQEQEKTQAVLERQGITGLRARKAQTDLNTRIASRFQQAQETIGKLNFASIERSMDAVNQWTQNWIAMTQVQEGLFRSFWNTYTSLTDQGQPSAGFRAGGGTRVGGEGTGKVTYRGLGSKTRTPEQQLASRKISGSSQVERDLSRAYEQTMF